MKLEGDVGLVGWSTSSWRRGDVEPRRWQGQVTLCGEGTQSCFAGGRAASWPATGRDPQRRASSATAASRLGMARSDARGPCGHPSQVSTAIFLPKGWTDGVHSWG